MTTEQDAVDAVVTFTIHRPERLAYRIADMGGDEDALEYHAWYADERVAVRDGRCVADHFSLDREGFVLLQSPTGVADFYDSETFRGTYDPEIEALVRRETGAAEVAVFDHTIRVQSDDKRREKKVRETVKLAHNDYTEKSGPQRVRDLLGPEEAARRLAHRYAFYNLWRPIAGPVLSLPLALCEAGSVEAQDWVVADLVYADRVGEIYNLAWSRGQRWWYFPRMTTDEILLFKCFDSARDGRARFTPHTAFDDPTTPPGAPPRESIETRVVAFFDD